jgi:hypothetical protein
VEPRAAAEYYVLYRLAEQGLLASPASSAGADLVACNPGGSRVALLRVHVRDARGGYGLTRERVSAARNRAHVFVDLPESGVGEPVCFVVPAVVVAAAFGETPGWPAGAARLGLTAYEEAWHLLGLKRAGGVRSSSVRSPSSPASH